MPIINALLSIMQLRQLLQCFIVSHFSFHLCATIGPLCSPHRQLNHNHYQQKNSYTHHIPISLCHFLLLYDRKTGICDYKKLHRRSTCTCRNLLPIYHGKNKMYTIENKTYKYLPILPLFSLPQHQINQIRKSRCACRNTII